MNVVLLGAPGAGKGTQAAVLTAELGIVHVASGDLFRRALQEETELGLLAKSYMEKGELVPDEVTINMVLERIRKPDCDGGVLFDGFPRTLSQAKALDARLAEEGRALDRTVYIEVPEDELVKRLSGRWICRECQTPYHEITSPPKTAGRCDACGGELYQRADDKAETVRERLKVFFTQTMPIVDYYDRQGKLVRVDGNQRIDEVSAATLRLLRTENA
ncbi:MAG: adenylate kinase [Dehalococcoidia bacterium]|jgi:adenylate kinase|nr:adenylate kinase [Dehalococcoidia bacterium]